MESVQEYLGILIDYERDKLIPKKGLSMLTRKGFYKKEWEDSPQQGFARAATCFSFGDYELAQRIYDYASKGWFTNASPVLSNAIEIDWPTFSAEQFEEAGEWLEENVVAESLPISCFTAGTPIYTVDGIKNIEDLREGDLVLTHKGRYRRVLATKESESNDIYELQCSSNTTKVNVTGNHLMLTNSGWKRVDSLVKGVDLIANTDSISDENRVCSEIYIESCYSVKPKVNSGNYDTKEIPTKILVDEELAWALGFWFAEGSTSNNGQVRVTHGDIEPCDKWQRIISSKFNLNGKAYNTKGRNWCNGEVNSVALQRTFDNLFGKGCKLKKLPHAWMITKWNKGVFKSFLDGFYLGDGFKTTKSKMFELTNTVLCSQIALHLIEQGYRVSTQYRKYIHHNKKKDNGVYNGVITYRDRDTLSKVGTRDGVSMDNGLRYVSINSLVKLTPTLTKVYDIQVEEDESFSVAGMIAHNCFLSFTPDTKEGLVTTRAETAWLSMMGGGIGIYTGMRSPDEKSTGAMAHLRGYDADALAYKQTETRRGSIGAYMDINHPEILSFLEMRNPIGGDANKKCFNLNNAVNITDDFMSHVIAGDKFELVDPKHGPTDRWLDAREVWEKVLQMRYETGEPYLHFIDTTNRNIPSWITKPTYQVRQSNLC